MKYSPDEVITIINRYVERPLRKMGQQWLTYCPFHDDKTPSFSVNPERGVWHCFGCQAGGGIRAFLERVGGADLKLGRDVSSSSPKPTGNNSPAVVGWLRDLGEVVETAALEGCRQQFALVKCNDCGAEVVHPVTCKSRLCYHCSGTRAQVFLSEHMELLERMGATSLLELRFRWLGHLSKKLLAEVRAMFTEMRGDPSLQEAFAGGIYGFSLKPITDGWEVGLVVVGRIPEKWELPIMVDWILRFHGRKAWIRLHQMGSVEAACDEFVRLCCLPPGWFQDKEHFAGYYYSVKGSRLVQGFGSAHAINGGRLLGKSRSTPTCPFCGSTRLKFLCWVHADHCTLQDGAWRYDGPRPAKWHLEGALA